MLVQGTAVGGYRVLGRVGEGGLATVYRVRHATLNTEHALKVLKNNTVQLRQRILQEGRIQASLRHPNVVTVTDVVEVDGHMGLVLEFIDGPTLADLLAEGAPLPLRDAIALFRQLLSGVGAAHRLGVLHRDLKPSNVLLAVDGRRVVAKITDFGVAKAGEESPMGPRTRTGTMLGTPGYMAPEQALDAARADLRADVFSLGAVLYELVAGRPAFDGPDMLAVLNAAAGARYASLMEVVPGCPPALADAVACALDPDPTRRFADCDAFARALDEVGGDLDLPMPAALAPRLPTEPDRASPTYERDAFPTLVLAQAPEARRETPPEARWEPRREGRWEIQAASRPRRLVPVPRPRPTPKPTRRQRLANLRRRAGVAARATVVGACWTLTRVVLPLALVAAIGAGVARGARAYTDALAREAHLAREELLLAVPAHLDLADRLLELGAPAGRFGAARDAVIVAAGPEAAVDAERLLYEAMRRELDLLPPSRGQAEELRRRAVRRDLDALDARWEAWRLAEAGHLGALDSVEGRLASLLPTRTR